MPHPVRGLQHWQAVLLMVLVTLLWSVAGVVSRQIEAASGMEITFWRSFFTLISLAVMLPWLRGPTVLTDLRRAPPALWISGLCWSVMFTAFMVALSLTSVAHVLATTSVGPLFTALTAWLLIGHPIPPRTWIAIAIAGLGIITMQFGQLEDGQWLGGVIALCVPLAGAINWTTVQHSLAQGKDVDLLPAVAVGAFISSAATLAWAMPFQASPRDLMWLAGLGLFQLAIPCSLLLLAARVLKAPELALLVLLEAVFGILLTWMFTTETPTLQVLLGGALVLVTLAVNEFLGWRIRRI
ncbi:MAG: DMT family transporter [Polaromonas sp.]